MTSERDFKEVCELMKHKLAVWTQKIQDDHQIASDTKHLPPIGLAFKNQQYDEVSDTSFQTYLLSMLVHLLIRGRHA